MSSKFRAFSLGCVAAALSWSAQAAQVTLDFETIGLAASSTGTAVGNTLGNGLTFSANALAFHNGKLTENDLFTSIPTRPNNFGYVRGFYDGNNFTSFTIKVDATKSYDRFALTVGVAAQAVEIYAYDASGVVLNTGLHSFQSNNLFQWMTSPYTLVDGSKGRNIDHITFNVATLSAFAIDDLQFTEAAGGGGTVPEPAGLGLVVLALAAAGAASRRGKSV